MFLLFVIFRIIFRDDGLIQDCRRVVSVTIRHVYRRYLILIYCRIVIRVSSSPPTEGGFTSAGTARTVCWLAAIPTSSHIRFEHQEIRFGYFESIKTRFETVTVTKTIQTRKHVIIHRTAAKS